MSDKSGAQLAMEHAWKYFEVHAAQRLSIFNFFVVMLGSVTAGVAATFETSHNWSYIGLVLSFVLLLLSFVFWKLDQRTAFLVKHAEQVLIEAEKALLSDSQRIFTSEVGITSKRTRGPAFQRMWTYSQSFRLIFVFAALLAVLGFAISLNQILRA